MNWRWYPLPDTRHGSQSLAAALIWAGSRRGGRGIILQAEQLHADSHCVTPAWEYWCGSSASRLRAAENNSELWPSFFPPLGSPPPRRRAAHSLPDRAGHRYVAMLYACTPKSASLI